MSDFGVEPVDPGYRGEVAPRYRYRDGRGEVGVIASVTQPFCGDCTRARLSAEGSSSPASSPSAVTTCARWCAAAPRTRSSPRRSRGLAPPHRPLLRAPLEATKGLPKVEMSYIGG